MDLSDLGKTIAKFAPLLGTALAGPGGAAIGSMIAAKFGGDVEDTKGLEHLIQIDPDAANKLKQIELANEAKLQELIVQDRINARQREIELAKAGFRDNTGRILALGYMAIFGVILLISAIFPQTVDQATISQLFDLAIGIITFHFGGLHKNANT